MSSAAATTAAAVALSGLNPAGAKAAMLYGSGGTMWNDSDAGDVMLYGFTATAVQNHLASSQSQESSC